MPSCFITGLHVYDNRGLCACEEKGRPWTSRQEERKDAGAMTTDNRTNEPTAEQIVYEALGHYGLIGRARERAARNAVGQLRAHGLLSEGAPSEAQVEAAAEAIHNLMQGDPSFKDSGRKREMRIYARAALVAAQGAARPVNSFDTTAERVKTGADSLHVAPQEPNQNETKSGNNFVSLDPEQVAAQGAAPQAHYSEPVMSAPQVESEDNVMCRCGHGTGSHDFSDPQESCREIVCDCRGWFGVSPVLPSSGVDEDARAEVIGNLDWGYMVDGPSVSEIARAVVEWLKGQER